MKKFLLISVAFSLPALAFAGGYYRPPVKKQSSAVLKPSYEVPQTRTLRYIPYRLSSRYSDSRDPVVSTKILTGNDLDRESERQSAARNKLMRLRSIGR